MHSSDISEDFSLSKTVNYDITAKFSIIKTSVIITKLRCLTTGNN